MTFATWPIAAIAAAIAVPALVILYFLKLRRRDMEVSSTILWKKAIQDLQANAPFQKLRNNILLILQLLALIAALLAIAQPEFRSRGAAGTRQIILIDRSASMSATDSDASPSDASKPGIARLESARKQAIDLVNNLREPGLFDDKAEEAMVIAFDTSAHVVQTFTSNKSELRSAISAITPTDAPSGLERAFDLAKAYTGTKKFEDQITENVGFVPSAPGATMHLFSDGRLPDSGSIHTGPEDTVIYHAIGTPEAVNVGITGLRAERAFDNPARVNVFVGLQSTDLQPRKVDVELSVDGVISRVNAVTIAAATRAVGADAAGEDTAGREQAQAKSDVRPGLGGFVFPLDRAEGGTATIRITPAGDAAPDVLDADNVAFLRIPPARRLSVVLVTTGNLFAQSALQGLNLSKFDVKSPAQFQAMLDTGQTAQYDVMIFDRVLPEVKAGEKGRGPGLPPGRSLVLGAVPPPPLGAVDEGPGDPAVIVDFQRDHPALRLSSLDKINIGKSRRVKIAPDTPVKVLARDPKGPAIFEVTDAASVALVVAFDVAETDWPFDPGWVLFLAGSVMYLSETQSGALSEGVRVGDTLSTRLPAGATDVSLSTPAKETIRLEPASDGTVSYGPISIAGLYTVRWNGQSTALDAVEDGRASRPIAANLLDPAESDLGTRASLALARGEVAAKTDRTADLTRKLWPYLLLGALAIVIFEWFIYNRKVAV